MLSRVAESVYWMNRYMERIENYARFVSVNSNLSLDAPGLFAEEWEPLLTATADNYLFYQYHQVPTRENVIEFMTFDQRNPNSIFSCLSMARENARTIREVLPKELWEHLNGFYLHLKEISKQKEEERVSHDALYEFIKKGAQLFWGMIDSTLSRDEGYHFGRLGRFIERADKTSRFLDVNYFAIPSQSQKSASPQELLIWSAVLKSVSAFNMYRQKYKSMEPIHLVEFLILDKIFPRSIYYCIREAELSLYEISGRRFQDSYSNEAERAIGKLRNAIEFKTIDEIFEEGLHGYLDAFQRANNQIGQEVFDQYFAWKPIE
ncbi:MAG: alpha-E domain-containing protein [Spirosomataceae bacterium]